MDRPPEPDLAHRLARRAWHLAVASAVALGLGLCLLPLGIVAPALGAGALYTAALASAQGASDDTLSGARRLATGTTAVGLVLVVGLVIWEITMLWSLL